MLMHSIMDPTVGTFAGSIVELTDVLTLDIHIPTEHVLPTEDIPPASDNILVRFTVGITRPAQTIAPVAGGTRIVADSAYVTKPGTAFEEQTPNSAWKQFGPAELQALLDEVARQA